MPGGSAFKELMPQHATTSLLLHKTRICRHWADTGVCYAGETCCFAHGEVELRQKPPQAPTPQDLPPAPTGGMLPQAPSTGFLPPPPSDPAQPWAAGAYPWTGWPGAVATPGYGVPPYPAAEAPQPVAPQPPGPQAYPPQAAAPPAAAPPAAAPPTVGAKRGHGSSVCEERPRKRLSGGAMEDPNSPVGALLAKLTRPRPDNGLECLCLKPYSRCIMLPEPTQGPGGSLLKCHVIRQGDTTRTSEHNRTLLGGTRSFCAAFWHSHSDEDGARGRLCWPVDPGTGAPVDATRLSVRQWDKVRNCAKTQMVIVARLRRKREAPSSAVNGGAAEGAEAAEGGGAEAAADANGAQPEGADSSASSDGWESLYTARYADCFRGSSDVDTQAEEHLLSDHELLGLIAGFKELPEGSGEDDEVGALELYLSSQPSHERLIELYVAVLRPRGITLTCILPDVRAAPAPERDSAAEEGSAAASLAEQSIGALEGVTALQLVGVGMRSFGDADWSFLVSLCDEDVRTKWEASREIAAALDADVAPAADADAVGAFRGPQWGFTRHQLVERRKMDRYVEALLSG